MPTFEFRQVDVFGARTLGGNPLAVVHGAEGIDDAAMARFANWTNLSETTFLLAPTDPRADYRVRIFTPHGELPFAGHPTLGSCHAWAEAGGQPKDEGEVVQECGVGLVRVRRGASGRLAFAAPPLRRDEAAEETLVRRIASGLGVPRERVLDCRWIVNGPEWIGVRFGGRDEVLALRPDEAALAGLKLGVVAPSEEADADFEVRAFIPGTPIGEDPVTGSLNAGLAQWLIREGIAPAAYVAAQGTALGRAGRVHVETADGEIWIGGDAQTVVAGRVTI
jgi:PhzF family phenazine biosynthesis protein